MVRSIISLLVILVVGILAYNFFFGTTEEKEKTKQITSQLKEVGVAIKGLLMDEKEKLDEGKYDKALDQIKNLFDNVKNSIKIDPDKMEKLKELEQKRDDLANNLKASEDAASADDTTKQAEQEKIKQELEQLLKATEKLFRELKAEE